jgi:hypothetical protein
MASTLVATISTSLAASTAQAEPSPSASIATIRAASTYRGHTAEEWAGRFRYRTRQLQHVRTHLQQRWHPTVLYALRLASAVTGVSYWQLYTVSRCESGHNPFAQNGQYKGLFQMHWSPFGFSPFDPVANALSAAMTVVHDGGWRQWACQP